MKWLMVIVSLGSVPGPDIDREPLVFVNETECGAAADAFVQRFPWFERWAPPPEGGLVSPVLRSYVQCQPAEPPDED